MYNFKPMEARAEAVKWIQEMASKYNFNQAVLGISGGKDSTVAAALCVEALGAKNVHGILLPSGIQPDIDDSITVCKCLGIKYSTINIKPIIQAFIWQYALFASTPCDITPNREFTGPSEDALINLSPRIRMTLLRLWGQTYHHRLCGTGNLSEITVGYCTKDGDTSCDFNPLGGLTSVEVVEIGKTYQNIPLELILKEPSDGLCGVSDEEKLNLKYADIHEYIRDSDAMKEENPYTWDLIHNKEKAGLHKRTTSPKFKPSEGVLYD